MGNQIFSEKKIAELLENEKRLQQDIDAIKNERDQRSMEYQQNLDREREILKVRINEIEDKYRESERKRSTLIFEHEKERAKWNLEKDHVVQQRNDLQDQMSKLEKRKELLLRENEKLKNDSKMNRRSNMGMPNVGASFHLNLSRNLGAATDRNNSDKKSPINSSRLQVLNNFNKDLNMINTSAEITKSQTSEEEGMNKENSILGSILDSSRGDFFHDRTNDPTGFKSFQQMMQERNDKEKKEQDVHRSIESTLEHHAYIADNWINAKTN